MKIISPAFDDGGTIPEKYGYTEQNVNPPLRISGVQEEAESLALVMDDPDAEPVAGKVWDHWVLYGIPPSVTSIEEGGSPGTEGRTDYDELGYGGPNPPDGPHEYVFKLYALDTELGLDEGVTKEELEQVMDGHVLEQAVLKGTYVP
ncbi:MAG: YbhB/YbcL family Raf kinase inhibitor-like protein [Candidatus Nanohaloarchaeota archaeon QJJ-7]|nr:YbhB/YbcL family Raf kinase inhibitor-like protein [Candidatus Nanohaloarchaeota archaeon QJJ-7]